MAFTPSTWSSEPAPAPTSAERRERLRNDKLSPATRLPSSPAPKWRRRSKYRVPTFRGRQQIGERDDLADEGQPMRSLDVMRRPVSSCIAVVERESIGAAGACRLERHRPTRGSGKARIRRARPATDDVARERQLEPAAQREAVTAA